MITHATDEDLNYLKQWLEAEYKQFGEGFWVNWSHIERAHQQGRLIVFRENGLAIALHTHDELLTTDSILVVHPDRRGQGIGQALAKRVIEKARDAGAALFEIDCAPATSKPFWMSLGFKPVKDRSGYQADYAYMPLEKNLPLPDEGKPVSVTVRFFGAHSTVQLSEHHVEGRQLDDGTIALGRRVIGFSKPTTPDIEVSVSIDGHLLLAQGRAKYRDAYGFVCQDGACYLDRILPAEAAAAS